MTLEACLQKHLWWSAAIITGKVAETCEWLQLAHNVTNATQANHTQKLI